MFHKPYIQLLHCINKRPFVLAVTVVLLSNSYDSFSLFLGWTLQYVSPQQRMKSSHLVWTQRRIWIYYLYLFVDLDHRKIFVGKKSDTTNQRLPSALNARWRVAGMLEGLALKHEGHHHSGLDDCRNIARTHLRDVEFRNVPKTPGGFRMVNPMINLPQRYPLRGCFLHQK